MRRTAIEFPSFVQPFLYGFGPVPVAFRLLSCDPGYIVSDAAADPSSPDKGDLELESEYRALERIRRVQAAHIERTVAMAARLALSLIHI